MYQNAETNIRGNAPAANLQWPQEYVLEFCAVTRRPTVSWRVAITFKAIRTGLLSSQTLSLGFRKRTSAASAVEGLIREGFPSLDIIMFYKMKRKTNL